MTWQDAILGAGNFVFAIALVPSVRGRQKPALASSLITATGLWVFGITFATLGLWLSMAGAWTSAAMWWVLAWQVRVAKAATNVQADSIRYQLALDELREFVEANAFGATANLDGQRIIVVTLTNLRAFIDSAVEVLP